MLHVHVHTAVHFMDTDMEHGHDTDMETDMFMKKQEVENLVKLRFSSQL
jgi:hypothetical protein